MSVVISRLVAEVVTDHRQFEAGMRTVHERLDETPRRAQDASQRTARSMGIIDEGVKQVGSSLRQAAVGGVAFVAGMAVVDRVGDAFAFVGDAAIGMNDRLDQAKIGFTTMLGSSQAAEAHLERLADFAARTPFEFQGLVETSQRMLALGFSAERTVPLLTAVGNAAAALGSGQQGIDRITTALGQMQARTKVSADEMLQLTEAGIPAWQLLADSMGLSVAQTQKLVEQGKVAAPVFIDAFEAFSKAKYGDMMAQQAKTHTGATNTILDNTRLQIAEGFDPLFERVKRTEVAFAEFTQTAEFDEWGENTSRALTRVLTAFERVGESAATANRVLEQATGRGLLETVARAVPGVSQLVTAFDLLSDETAEWGEQGGRLRESLDDATASAEALGGAVAKTSKQVADAWSDLRGRDLADIAASFTDMLKPEEVAKAAAGLADAFDRAADEASQRLREINEETAEDLAAAVAARQERVDAAERQMADKLEEAIRSTGKRLAEAQADAAEDHAAALTDHAERVAAVHERAGETRSDAIAREHERVDDALDAANAATLEAVQGAAERELDARADAARRIADAQQAAAESLRASQERYAEDAAEAVRAAAERIRDAQRATAERIADATEGLEERRRDRSSRDVFDAGQSAEERARRQSREDAEALYQHERDLAEAADDEERQRLEERFRRSEDARARRRALDEEDRAFREKQDAERRAFEDAMADDALRRTIARIQAEQAERDRAIEADSERRLRALGERFADELAATQRTLERKEAAERASLERSLQDNAEALEKRRQQIAARRDAEIAEAQADREERLAAAGRDLARELSDLDEQLAKKQAAIEAQLAKERLALGEALAEKRLDLAADYAADVAEADRALERKVGDVEKRADEEREKVQTSLYQRERDLWDFLERLPDGSAIKTDNFVDALWWKLENVRLTANAADEAVRRLAGAPPVAPPAYPGQLPQPSDTGGYWIDGVWHPSRDTGGRGVAGQGYAIGVKEVFVPDSPGTFVPLGGAQVVAGGWPDRLEIVLEVEGERLATAVLRAQDFNRQRLAGVGT